MNNPVAVLVGEVGNQMGKPLGKPTRNRYATVYLAGLSMFHRGDIWSAAVAFAGDDKQRRQMMARSMQGEGVRRSRFRFA